MLLEPPTAGSVKISVRAPNFNQYPDIDELDYCQNLEKKEMSCIYWTNPTSCEERACLVSTRVNITNFSKNVEGCDDMGLLTSKRECSFDPLNNKDQVISKAGYYAAHAEYSTIYIEHSIRGFQTETTLFSYSMNGKALQFIYINKPGKATSSLVVQVATTNVRCSS